MKATLKCLAILLVSLYCTAASAQYNVERLLISGRIALHYEDYVLSIQYFNQAISQKPHLWEPWQLRAIAKFYLDDWQGAENDATQAIERNPYITTLYDLRGISFIRQKDYDSAIADYTKAITLDSGNRGYWYNRAVCYVEKADYNTAHHELDSIISRWKKYAQPYLLKAETFLLQKDTARAEEWLDNTLLVESYNADAWRMKGHIALSHERWKEADSCLSKALHYKPKNVGCYVNRALARLRLNNLRGAMNDYDTALEHDPNNFLAHYNRGLLRSQVGDDNRAIEDFNYVLTLEPGNVMALFNRATLLDRTGDLRGAIRDYSTVIRQFPDFWTGLHYRASCYRRLGMTAKAEQDEFRILKAQMNKHLGIQNRWSKAKLNAMRKLSDIDPEKYNQIVIDDENEQQHEYSSAYRGKVQNRPASEQFQPYMALTMAPVSADNVSSYVPYSNHAIHFMERLRKANALNELTAVRLGNVGEGTGVETFMAVDSLTNMIAHATDMETAMTLTMLRAVAYSSAQNYQDAIADLNKVLERQPDNFMALWHKAVCEAMMAEYEKTSTPKEAEMRAIGVNNDFGRLLTREPSNALVAYCQGTYYARTGNNVRAIELLTSAIENDPNMPYAYYNRGLVYMKTGEVQKAKRDFSKSGELGLYGAYSLLKK